MGETNKKKNFFPVRSSSAVGFNEGQDMADLLHPRHCWRCEVLLLLLFWKWRQKRDDTDATSWNTLMDQEREGKEYKDVKHKKKPSCFYYFILVSFFLFNKTPVATRHEKKSFSRPRVEPHHSMGYKRRGAQDTARECLVSATRNSNVE